MKVLALDLGASGGKIFSGSFDGSRIHMEEIHRFHNQPVKQGRHLQWDIHRIYSNLLEGIRRAAPLGFESLGVDSFCNDYALLDEVGALTGPVIMYRDVRTEEVLETRLDPIFPARDLYTRTGCQRARFNTLVQLAAQMHSPGCSMIEQADTLLFVPDLLNYFLCGEKAAEYTIASVSQLYNRLEDGWDKLIMQAFDLPERIFPPVLLPAGFLGHASRDICENTGAKPFRICTVGHHDTASAVVAVPSTMEHFAYISSGTWSLVGTETDEMITTEPAYRNNFANEGGLGGRNRFLKNVMGLWLLQECRRELAGKKKGFSFEELEAQAETAQAFRSIINPDDPLLFEPGDMIGRIRRKCEEGGQPIPETPGQLARCILESLALAYRFTLEQMEACLGVALSVLHVIGGGARSSLLNQFTASAAGRLVLAGPYEAAALGNVCAQLMAAGEIQDLAEARRVVSASVEMREFQPDGESGWQEAYSRFLEIIAGGSKPGDTSSPNCHPKVE